MAGKHENENSNDIQQEINAIYALLDEVPDESNPKTIRYKGVSKDALVQRLNFLANQQSTSDVRVYRYQVETELSIITSFANLIDICEKCNYPAVPSSFLSNYISPNSKASSNYANNHGQQSVSSASTANSTTSNTLKSIKTSNFRLWMVLHTPSKFNLCDWLINDELLETYIIDKLFEGNKDNFDQIITDYANFLNIIRKAFYYYYNRSNGTRSLTEKDFQYIFILLLNSLIKNTDIKAEVVAANNIKLETTIQASDNKTNTQYSAKRLVGFGDIIGIPDDLNNIVDDDIENNNFYYHSIFNGELKMPADPMMHSACYKEIDQLLGETKAIGDLKSERGTMLTKSLLTDLFSLMICFRVSDNYFISSRVTDPKQYLVRILFCLCEFDESSLNSFITVENTFQKSDEDIVNETKDESIPDNFNNGNIFSRSNNDNNISERNINHQHSDHDHYKKSNLDSSLNIDEDVDENAPFVNPNILRKYVDYEYLSESLLRLHNRNQNFP